MKNEPSLRRRPGAGWELIVLLTAATLIAAFVALRYGGLWGETDTAAFAQATRAMLAEGSLVPSRYVYSNGYGFPALATFLVQITGLSVAQLQIFGGALLMVWIVLPAWLAYRELTGTARGAALATVIILVQPEFLFPILRGSHEKFTRGLMFMAIYLLVRSILSRRKWRRFVSFLLAFYLVIYALITFNNLLAISFITSLGLSLALGLTMRQLAGSHGDDSSATQRRLFYAVGISLVLAFFFTFYAYAPATNAIQIVKSVADKIALLFLSVEESANPYTTVLTAWISLPVYLLVSIANWLLLVLSFILWATQTVRWWRGRSWPEEPRVILLWSLYGAFGFLGAVSIVVDLSGALSANLQHRMFPSIAMVAAPFVAEWFVRWQTQQPATRRLVYGMLAVVVAFLSVVAIAKATNEPSLSNKWNYYAPAEFTGLAWTRRSNPDTVTWTAFDERLRAAIAICCDWEAEGAQFDSSQPEPGTGNFLISDVTRARAERLGVPLPVAGDGLLVYDNGAAEIYHRRPVTPFQK